MSTRATRRSRGLSLVELTIATAIFVGVLLIVQEVLSTTERAQVYINARDRSSQYASKLIADLRGAGLSSRRFFQDDAEGQSYLAALNTASFPVMADVRLPVVEAAGRLETDAVATRLTGNAILIACEDRPQILVGGTSRYRVDLVRFFAMYPTRRPGKVIDSIADRIDLVRYVSRLYADKASLEQISNASHRAEVVMALHAQGITRAWVPGVAIDSAFFNMASDGSISATPVSSPVIDAPPEALPRTMLGDSKVSLSPNNPALRVPSFALLDVTAPDFPSGFEVKAVGPSGGRQVLVRLCLIAAVRDGPDADSTTTRLFSVRDL